ncbi:MAG: NADAR family protein, partial [Chitinophagaceae bacterium]
MKYNNQWLMQQYKEQERIKFLFFWGHQAPKDGNISKACFSQWWVAPFEYEGQVYQTAEHWMMAGKARLFDDQEVAERILA